MNNFCHSYLFYFNYCVKFISFICYLFSHCNILSLFHNIFQYNSITSKLFSMFAYLSYVSVCNNYIILHSDGFVNSFIPPPPVAREKFKSNKHVVSVGHSLQVCLPHKIPKLLRLGEEDEYYKVIF